MNKDAVLSEAEELYIQQNTMLFDLYFKIESYLEGKGYVVGLNISDVDEKPRMIITFNLAHPNARNGEKQVTKFIMKNHKQVMSCIKYEYVKWIDRVPKEQPPTTNTDNENSIDDELLLKACR